MKDYEIIAGPAVGQWLTFIDATQKASREEIGFLPLSWIEEKIADGLVAVVLINGEPGGYVTFGSPRQGETFHWFQVAIDYSLRRQHYGAALVQYIEGLGSLNNVRDIRFKCAADIEANAFWQEQGYRCAAHLLGGVRRNRWLNVYHKALWPELFTLSVEPMSHETRAEVWKPASGYNLSPWHRLDQATLKALSGP